MYAILLRGEYMYNRIRGLREDNDLTQSEISRLLNCSQQAYSSYELGKREIPIDFLLILAKFYKTSIDYIVELTDEKKPYSKK